MKTRKQVSGCTAFLAYSRHEVTTDFLAIIPRELVRYGKKRHQSRDKTDAILRVLARSHAHFHAGTCTCIYCRAVPVVL